MYLALLLIVPIILCLMARAVDKRFGIAAFLVAVGACVLLSLGGLAVEFWSATSDTEIWNGCIVAKTRDVVSCRHSYDCNCHTDKDGHSHCQTCYEHFYDVDWNLHFSTGKVVGIPTADRQGLLETPRWGAAYVGEPTAETREFTNYLLAATDSILLHHDAPEGFSGLVPPYPGEVYDYYRCNRFLLGGAVPVRGEKDWQWLLDRLNADLGAAKQVNVIVVLAFTDDPRYQYALEKEWVGGKKNDLIVLIGTTRYPKISWVRIVSWSTAEDLKVVLRDDIQAIGTLDRRDDIMGAVRKEVQGRFERRHMRDLKYLAASHQPGGRALGIILFLECVTVLATAFASANLRGDYCGGCGHYRSYHRYY